MLSKYEYTSTFGLALRTVLYRVSIVKLRLTMTLQISDPPSGQ